MKRKILGLSVFLALALAACSPAPAPAPAPTPAMTVIVEPTSPPPGGLPKSEAEVPRVTAEAAKAAFEAGAAVIVDVRSVDSFVAKHIAGALSIPLTRIEQNPKSVSLDKDQWIITYCT
ncbi:MAG: rhodanese-like domain-containing protein [Anaerolineae bacterium CFX3]|nr:rhodanese-like domain-containing protein [Anaerolineae bacterium CFX3]MCQ3945681.1 hypothetical protein [Anaerolineae bacterium]RIK25188.1 MAG: hypothetical protein DCC54_11330 [Anaerolineae bacterium]